MATPTGHEPMTAPSRRQPSRRCRQPARGAEVGCLYFIRNTAQLSEAARHYLQRRSYLPVRTANPQPNRLKINTFHAIAALMIGQTNFAIPLNFVLTSFGAENRIIGSTANLVIAR